MNMPSTRIFNEMMSESASVWYVPANRGEEIAVLIKATTPAIKALLYGCDFTLQFGKKDNILCVGVNVIDVPDASLFFSRVERHLEEHLALIRVLKERKFPLFLFNEMNMCVARTNAELLEQDASEILGFIGEASSLYVGRFTKAVSHALDCFCDSVEKSNMYPNSHPIPFCEIKPSLEAWRINSNIFLGVHEYNTLEIDDINEGDLFERTIWAALESTFPLTLYKNPQVVLGNKTRELTDILSFYEYRTFFIAAKDSSVLKAGYARNQERRTAGVQKQVKKAIKQLLGAVRVFDKGETILDNKGNELKLDRDYTPHCIILVTEIMNYGDWSEIIDLLEDAMKKTDYYFTLLDFREFVNILKVSSRNPKRFHAHLIQHSELIFKNRTVFIRGIIKP